MGLVRRQLGAGKDALWGGDALWGHPPHPRGWQSPVLLLRGGRQKGVPAVPPHRTPGPPLHSPPPPNSFPPLQGLTGRPGDAGPQGKVGATVSDVSGPGVALAWWGTPRVPADTPVPSGCSRRGRPPRPPRPTGCSRSARRDGFPRSQRCQREYRPISAQNGAGWGGGGGSERGARPRHLHPCSRASLEKPVRKDSLVPRGCG